MKEIDELEGRELDAAVAERVMGAEPLERDGDGSIRDLHQNDEGQFESFLPPYSTDIAAAFQVVEKLRRKGFSFCCWDTPEFFSFSGKMAAFRHGVHPPSRDDLEDCFVGSGHMEDSMALAITRAALKASGKGE